MKSSLDRWYVRRPGQNKHDANQNLRFKGRCSKPLHNSEKDKVTHNMERIVRICTRPLGH